MLDIEALLARIGVADTDTLLQGIRDIQRTRDMGPQWIGQLTAQLRRPPHSVPLGEIVRLTGMSKGTLIRYAEPYRLRTTGR
jgi:hypothetical protein